MRCDAGRDAGALTGRTGVAAYSLMSHDHVKLKYLFDLIKPAW